MLSDSVFLPPKSTFLSPKTTGQRHFVLIHGACHGAWCWYKVSTLLKSAGHKVSALDLAASGVNPKHVHQLHSFSDYFQPLTEFMASLSAQERILLVGHSMGGFGVSVAMEKFPKKISAGVFVAASMPGPDLTYNTIAAKYAERFKSSNSMDTLYIFGNGPNDSPTALLLGPNQMATKLYHFSPPEDLELAKLLVRPHPVFSNPGAADEMMVFSKERHGSVSRIFIICDEENAEEQRWMIENNHPNEVKLISGSDHMVMLSKPQQLTSCLLEIGQSYC